MQPSGSGGFFTAPDATHSIPTGLQPAIPSSNSVCVVEHIQTPDSDASERRKEEEVRK